MSQSPWAPLPDFALEIADFSAPDETPPEVSFGWATVSSNNPLRIVPDGQTEPLEMTPWSLVDPLMLAFGDRVWVQSFGLRRLVLGSTFRRGRRFPDAPRTEMPLLSGWENYGSGFDTTSYDRISDWVSVTGLIKNGTTTAGTVIAKLPEGFRPPGKKVFTVGANSSGTWVVARIDVDTNGDILVNSGVSASYTSLENIAFRATQ